VKNSDWWIFRQSNRSEFAKMGKVNTGKESNKKQKENNKNAPHRIKTLSNSSSLWWKNYGTNFLYK
jgi:hypothetical protein